MKKKDKKESKKSKKVESEHKARKIILVIIVVILLIVMVTSATGYIYYNKMDKESRREIETLEKEFDEAIKSYEETIEYGTSWTYEDFLSNYLVQDKLRDNTKITLKVNDEEINQEEYLFDEVGEYKIEVGLYTTYKYKLFKTHTKEIKKDEDFTLVVEDTNMPTLEGVKDITITVGDTLDMASGVKASDVIDGEIEVKFEGDVDTSKAGTYKVVAYAVDKNGNKTEKEFNVIVKAKPVVNKPATNNNTSTNSNNNSTNNSTTNNNTNTNTNTNNTPNASTLNGRLALAKAEAKRVVAQIIKPGMSDREKAFEIFKYLHYNVSLQTNQSTEAYKTNFGNEAYAALIMKKAACSGFCKAVTLMCNEAGLQSQHINANQWTHQWNMVLIDGEWIKLDAQGGIFDNTFYF